MIKIENYEINVRGQKCWIETHQLDDGLWEFVFPKRMKLSEIIEEIQEKFKTPEKFTVIKFVFGQNRVTVDRNDANWMSSVVMQVE